MCLSLIKNEPNVNLWVLCLDKYTEDTIRKLSLKNITLITLSKIENEALKKVKKIRLPVEYYWTITPFLPLYIFRKNKQCTHVAYVDGDMFFYSSISPLVKEISNGSIYIIPHRFPKNEKNRESTSGLYNAGFVAFKRDKSGITCLRTWAKQCIAWCYWKEENGKMGNQMYLNEWPKKYTKVTISSNLGINAAPWNIDQYAIKKINNSVYINNDKLIFYHFHQFKVLGENKFSLCSRYIVPRFEYQLSIRVIEYIYGEYIQKLKEVIEMIKKSDSGFNYYEKRKIIALPNIKSIVFKK